MNLIIIIDIDSCCSSYLCSCDYEDSDDSSILLISSYIVHYQFSVFLLLLLLCLLVLFTKLQIVVLYRCDEDKEPVELIMMRFSSERRC